MFYIIFLFYLLMLLAVAIAKDCSGGFRSSSESDEIMRMEYEQKIQENRKITKRKRETKENKIINHFCLFPITTVSLKWSTIYKHY